MGIIAAVGETIKRYGSKISVISDGSTVNSSAFIEPLRYKNKVYVGGQYHHLGLHRNEKYLCIGPPDLTLEENKSVIQMQNKKYIVKRCEIYYVNDRAVYVWAILLQYGEALEDDYESD